MISMSNDLHTIYIHIYFSNTTCIITCIIGTIDNNLWRQHWGDCIEDWGLTMYHNIQENIR